MMREAFYTHRRTALYIILGAFFLMIPALLNGFPFMFPDSGDYLTIAPQIHRPPFYGLFITFAHLNRFIWMPVVLQCFLISHLIWLIGTRISSTLSSYQFLGIVGWLTVFSSLPYFTGFIMADIFTPIMFLCMVILCFCHHQLGIYSRLYLIALATIATVSHITNLALALSMLIVLLVCSRYAGISKHYRKRALSFMAMPIILAILALLSFNVVIFKNWTISSAGQSFFMANLIEYGPSRTYLQDVCPKAGYRICSYADSLPPTADDFLWQTNMFSNLGSFAGMREESAMVVKQTLLTRPMDVLTMVGDNFLHGLTCHEPAAEFRKMYHIPSMKTLLTNKFGEPTLAAYMNSAAMHDTIPHTLLHTIDSLLTPLAFFTLLAIGIMHRKKRGESAFLLPCVTLCFVLGNTLLCTTLSGVHDRYQSRVTWLMPMAIILLLVERKNKPSKVE